MITTFGIGIINVVNRWMLTQRMEAEGVTAVQALRRREYNAIWVEQCLHFTEAWVEAGYPSDPANSTRCACGRQAKARNVTSHQHAGGEHSRSDRFQIAHLGF